MRSWDLYNLTDADGLKPIVHKPSQSALAVGKDVVIRQTAEDVAAIEALQSLLGPLVKAGDRPSKPSVLRAAMKVTLTLEQECPGLVLKMLSLSKSRPPKRGRVPLPDNELEAHDGAKVE